VEARLAGIWEQVLGLEQVGIGDNFFELGGHSLLATQLISRVREQFSLELPLRSIFEEPTIAGLATQLDHALRAGQGLEIPPIIPQPRDTPIPLSFAQERLWLVDQAIPNTSLFNIHQTIRINGCLDLFAFQKSVEEIIQRHEILRTTFAGTDDGPVQVIGQCANEILTIVDLRSVPAPQIQAVQLASEAARQPFDLAHGPLLRLLLLQLSDDDYALVVTTHHIISDGWSMAVLFEELSALYHSHAHNLPAELMPLSFQYADYALWQRQWLNGTVLEQELNYWQQKLSGELRPLELPADHSRPVIDSSRTSRQYFLIPTAVAEEVARLGQAENCTSFIILLAAFKILLRLYTDERDIRVGTLVANRGNRDVERLIGLFVNTLLMRTDMSGDPSAQEFIQRVRSTALEAYAHQDIPFEEIVQALDAEQPDFDRASLFQVMFLLQNTPVPQAELFDLQVGSLFAEGEQQPPDTVATTFELVLILRENSQGLNGTVIYSSELFEAGTIEKLIEDYRSILAEIISAKDRSLSNLTTTRHKSLTMKG
jgi:acyl carrier protein